MMRDPTTRAVGKQACGFKHPSCRVSQKMATHSYESWATLTQFSSTSCTRTTLYTSGIQPITKILLTHATKMHKFQLIQAACRLAT